MIFESHPHSLHSWGTWMGCKSPSCCSQEGRTSENPATLSLWRLAKFPLVSGCPTKLPRAERSLREPSGSSQKTMGVGARGVNYPSYVKECAFTQLGTLSNLRDAGKGCDRACLLPTVPPRTQRDAETHSRCWLNEWMKNWCKVNYEWSKQNNQQT